VEILEVDLLTYEQGATAQRRAVVDGVRRSLTRGFVYVRHDLSQSLIDEAYTQLETFFSLPQERKDAYVVPGSKGQNGYTGLLVETAAVADVPDWKEMLNWGGPLGLGHPLRDRYPHRYGEPVLPENDLPGIADLLMAFHHSVADLQRRVLRIIAEGLGAHPSFFDEMMNDSATLTRAIHYPAMDQAPDQHHVWAGEHADINLITALPRATAAGLQVRIGDDWVDASAPDGQAIINTGMMLERVSNGVIPSGVHRVVSAPDQTGDRYSVVQFAHPTPWTILTPMPSTVTDDNPLRYSSIMASDALEKVLWDINLTETGKRLDQ